MLYLKNIFLIYTAYEISDKKYILRKRFAALNISIALFEKGVFM